MTRTTPFAYATLPDGILVEKRTTRQLTHIVAAQTLAGNWFVARWSASPQAAHKAADTIWPNYVKRVIPVHA